MNDRADLDPIKAYFEGKLEAHGPTPQGVDWKSDAAQVIRFEQLVRVIDFSRKFSVLDWGCGYGALAGYLTGWDTAFHYIGYDLSEKMIAQASALYLDDPRLTFTASKAGLPSVDYVLASGIFNLKGENDAQGWANYILATLDEMNLLGRRGFAFNLLTRYSDPGYMRPDLYYGDPGFFFDYCKTRFARNVALLHDYEIYDFTILVRKEAGKEYP